MIRDAAWVVGTRFCGSRAMSLQEKSMAKVETSKRTILFADNEETNRDLLAGLLEGAGYHAISVPDGLSVLSAVRESRVDLLDVVMPGKTGFPAFVAPKSGLATRIDSLSVKRTVARGLTVRGDPGPGRKQARVGDRR